MNKLKLKFKLDRTSQLFVHRLMPILILMDIIYGLQYYSML